MIRGLLKIFFLIGGLFFLVTNFFGQEKENTLIVYVTNYKDLASDTTEPSNPYNVLGKYQAKN